MERLQFPGEGSGGPGTIMSDDRGYGDVCFNFEVEVVEFIGRDVLRAADGGKNSSEVA